MSAIGVSDASETSVPGSRSETPQLSENRPRARVPRGSDGGGVLFSSHYLGFPDFQAFESLVSSFCVADDRFKHFQILEEWETFLPV